MKFYDIIKKLRSENKMSQNDIAARLSISRQAYSLYENGKREPSIDTIQQLAEIFNVSTDYLLGNSDKKEKPLVNEDKVLEEYLDELKNRPEMRMVFSLMKGATKEDVEKAVKIIEAYLQD